VKEAASATEENDTEKLPDLKFCKKGGKGVPGVDCRKDTRKNCKDNVAPADFNPALRKEMSCKVLPECETNAGLAFGTECYQTLKALKKIKGLA